ncbi:MAG: histidine phosphatase family protein [Acidimicrobiales bacterium]
MSIQALPHDASSQTGVSRPLYSDPARAPGRVLVVRHAETSWSVARRHTGLTDLPLLPDGEKSARSLGRRLRDLKPALVLSSPLKRALDTCRLAGYGETAETSSLLLEMDYGDYEGLSTPEVRARRPEWDLFVDGCPGGETIEDVGKRADSLIERLRGDPILRGQDVIVFGHGHVLRVLTARWLGLGAAEARHFALRPAMIGILGWEHEWPVLAAWNS